MRRIRKVIGTERLVPIIKEGGNQVTVIKKGYDQSRVSKISVGSDNIPVVQRRQVNVNLQKNDNRMTARV